MHSREGCPRLTPMTGMSRSGPAVFLAVTAHFVETDRGHNQLVLPDPNTTCSCGTLAPLRLHAGASRGNRRVLSFDAASRGLRQCQQHEAGGERCEGRRLGRCRCQGLRCRENAKSGRARKHFLRAQCIASIGETREDVVARNTWIILQDIGFAPPVGHQADHEFDGKSRAAYDRFAGEHVGRKRDARMIHDG